MKKQLLLFVILLLLSIPTFALNITILSVSSVVGGCAVGNAFGAVVDMSITGTTADAPLLDYYAFVVYDAYGTAIGVNQQTASTSSTISGLFGFNFGVQVAAAARPFTVKFHDRDATPITLATIVTYPVVATVSFDPATFGICTTLPLLATSASSAGVPHFTDGRINNYDMASSFVVYGHDFEDGHGLVVYSPDGDLLLTVTAEELGECTGETVLLASANGVSLYRLDTCEYQMMALSLDGTKNYILIFNEPYPNTGYSSHEE